MRTLSRVTALPRVIAAPVRFGASAPMLHNKERSLLCPADVSGEPQCSFLMFAQMQPSTISADNMKEYEQELAEPSGIRTARPPPATLDGILISQECSLIIEMKDVTTLQ
jgi:hypothetical protein